MHPGLGTSNLEILSSWIQEFSLFKRFLCSLISNTSMAHILSGIVLGSTNINSFIPLNNSMRKVLLLFLFCRQGNRNRKSLSLLSWATGLLSGKTGVWTHQDARDLLCHSTIMPLRGLRTTHIDFEIPEPAKEHEGIRISNLFPFRGYFY